MSNQIVISSGAKVRNLDGVLTGSTGVVGSVPLGAANGVATLDSGGKVPVSQLPSSVVTYLGTWDAATNTPTLTNGTGDAGDMYICNVAGTVNFGAGPVTFAVGDWVLYGSGTWEKSNGQNGTVTSVAVTESGDALSITGSPITTAGTINIGFAGTSAQYVNGAGGLTTFPTNVITGSGSAGQVTYFDGTNTVTSENSFVYDASTNRLGVNTSVPNATIGANAATDSGYSLLLKNDNANYNGIGFGTDSTYGNLISTEKQGTATAQNLTLLNQSGFVSLTETGNLGVGLLTPNTGLDIYNGTSAYLWLHTATSGTGGTDGVRLALFNTNGANLRNFEGAFSITAEGDFSVITLGAENFRVNSADGSIYQSKVSDAMLKTVSGVITAAVAGTDYLAPTSLSAYVPYTGATTNVDLGTHSLTAADLVINHASGSGVAASITKGGNGEALTVVKTSGSGNAASITGGITLLSELNLTTALADAYIASAATWNAKIGGSGVSGRVAYYDGTNSITSEGGFTYDSSTNRLGVNTTVPNATIGANAGTDSGYSLLLKNADTNYNGIGFGTDSTYGNLIATEKLGTATAKNITILNQSGFVSLTEGGNLGLNVLTPAVAGAGIDIYSSTSAGLRFHTATSGTTVSDGAGINFSSANNLGITNYEAGAIDIVTNGNSGVYINSSGYVGISGATPSTALTVNGAITQSSVTSSLLKTNGSGTIIAAVAGTDYVAPSALSGYLPLTGGNITGNLTIGSPASALAQFHIYNASAAATMLVQTNSSTDYAEIASRNYNSVSTAYYRQYSSSASGTDFGLSRANLATLFSNYASNFAIGTQNGGDLILGTANAERMRIAASTGNVVIGSSDTSSNKKLVVYSATADTHLGIIGAAPSIRFQDNFTATYSALFGMATASNNYVTGSVAGDFMITYNSANNLIFGNSNTSLEKMRLNSSGNLLINTTSGISGVRLQVTDTAPILGIQSNTTGSVYLRMYQGVDVVSSMYYNATSSTLTISNNNAGIQFNTSGVTNAFNLASTGAATFSSSVTTNGNAYHAINANITGSSYGTININSSGNRRVFMGYSESANTYGTFGVVDDSGVERGIQIVRATGAATFSSSVGVGGTISGNYPLTIRSGVADYTKILDWGTGAGGSWGTMTINTSAPYNTIFNSGGFAFTGGNVGIGTTSPAQKLDVSGIIRASGDFEQTGNNVFKNTSYDLYLQTDAASGGIIFRTASATERMRITSVGLVSIGLTGGTGRVNVQANPSNNYQMEFFNTVGGSVGSITVVGGGLNTAYNTSSDYRLKEDLKEYNGLSIISRLKTYDFKWKDTDVRDYGVMAHELAEVLPNYVNGEKDALDESGNIKPQGVDYSKIVPILVKAIQELNEKIKQLENK